MPKGKLTFKKLQKTVKDNVGTIAGTGGAIAGGLALFFTLTEYGEKAKKWVMNLKDRISGRKKLANGNGNGNGVQEWEEQEFNSPPPAGTFTYYEDF